MWFAVKNFPLIFKIPPDCLRRKTFAVQLFHRNPFALLEDAQNHVFLV